MPNESQSRPSKTENAYSLSPVQQGMLYHSLLAQGTGVRLTLLRYCETKHRLIWTFHTSAFPSMEQLVAPYVAALSSHIRFSSCVLAGYSFAGLMAFEAAHQFQRQGGSVDMVILFDTLTKYPTALEVAWHKWRQDWKQAPKGAVDRSTFTIDWILRNSWREARRMLRKARMSFRSLLPKPSGFALTTTLDEQGLTPLPIDRLYKKIVKSYRPHRLDSRGILFRAESRSKSYSRAFDDSLAWKNLFAGGLEIIPVAGDHESMFRHHHRALAQKMNEVLKRYWMHPDDSVNDNACEPRLVCTSGQR